MAEHKLEVSYPPEDPDHSQVEVRKKETTYVQALAGVVDSPLSPEEYYSLQSYQRLNQRTLTVGATAQELDFGVFAKTVWFYVPSTSPGGVWFALDGQAIAGDGSVGVGNLDRPEAIAYIILRRRISLISNGAGRTIRITWGW